MTIAVFPGSFDPITLGHMDIATRARAFADDVVLAVGVNASKSYVFDFAQRLALAEEAVKGIDGVRVAPMPGLLVDLCRELGANIIVKGLRSEADFSAEWPMALMNRHLTGIETASWMPLIILGSLIRETPPAARISAGIRSNAITAQAPAASAIRACSGVVTSMITPPFNI